MNLDDTYWSLVKHKDIFGEGTEIVHSDGDLMVLAQCAGIRIYFEKDLDGPDMLVAESIETEVGCTVLFGTNHSNVAQDLLDWWEWANGPENL